MDKPHKNKVDVQKIPFSFISDRNNHSKLLIHCSTRVGAAPSPVTAFSAAFFFFFAAFGLAEVFSNFWKTRLNKSASKNQTESNCVIIEATE